MRTMTIRAIPDDVYDALKRCAKRSHRSLQEQARIILEREMALIRGATAPARARQWRESLKGRRLGDVVADIRRERAR